MDIRLPKTESEDVRRQNIVEALPAEEKSRAENILNSLWEKQTVSPIGFSDE